MKPRPKHVEISQGLKLYVGSVVLYLKMCLCSLQKLSLRVLAEHNIFLLCTLVVT